MQQTKKVLIVFPNTANWATISMAPQYLVGLQSQKGGMLTILIHISIKLRLTQQSRKKQQEGSSLEREEESMVFLQKRSWCHTSRR